MGALSRARLSAFVALSAAFLSVSAMISVPFFVPFTLQTFAFYFIIYLFGSRVGLFATLVYTAIGLVGLPVFSGFSGGVGRLFEPSGGFIIGFVLAAVVHAALSPITWRRGGMLTVTLISLLVLYLSGATVLVLLYTDGSMASSLAAVAVYILPYLAPDAVKISLAAVLASRLRKHIKI